MIQFYLSKDAAADLKHLVEAPSPENYQAMRWYVHRVTIARRKCIIAMEKQSRYAITFCGLTKKRICRFPQLFSYWFSLHGLASVVEQYGQDDVLEQRVLELCAGDCRWADLSAGVDRSVMAHINQGGGFIALFGGNAPLSAAGGTARGGYFATQANEQMRKKPNQRIIFARTGI